MCVTPDRLNMVTQKGGDVINLNWSIKREIREGR